MTRGDQVVESPTVDRRRVRHQSHAEDAANPSAVHSAHGLRAPISGVDCIDPSARQKPARNDGNDFILQPVDEVGCVETSLFAYTRPRLFSFLWRAVCLLRASRRTRNACIEDRVTPVLTEHRLEADSYLCRRPAPSDALDEQSKYSPLQIESLFMSTRASKFPQCQSSQLFHPQIGRSFEMVCHDLAHLGFAGLRPAASRRLPSGRIPESSFRTRQ